MTPELLSVDKLKAVLKACSGKSFESVRDTAMLRLLVDSGMRRGQLAGIKVSDIDWDESVVTVLVKVPGYGRCPSEIRRWWRWTSTSGCESATVTLLLRSCGSASTVPLPAARASRKYTDRSLLFPSAKVIG
jgi:integrase